MDDRGRVGEQDGVLDEDYASDRTNSSAIRYRYLARARVAWELSQKYLPFRGFYNVLDLGCAEGKTLVELHRLFGGRGRFIGVEASKPLLQRAPTLPDNVQLLEGDACSPPEEVAEGSFDVVCALALLEHLQDPMQLAEAASHALKPGGIFVATCPNPLWDDVAGKLGLLKDEAHLQEMNREETLRVARVVGDAKYMPFMTVSLGALPYARIPVSAKLSSQVDRIVNRLPSFLAPLLFVNQAVVAQKPIRRKRK